MRSFSQNRCSYQKVADETSGGNIEGHQSGMHSIVPREHAHPQLNGPSASSTSDSVMRQGLSDATTDTFKTTDTALTIPDSLAIAPASDISIGKRRQQESDHSDCTKRHKSVLRTPHKEVPAQANRGSTDLEQSSFIKCWTAANSNICPTPDQLEAFEEITRIPYKALHRWFYATSCSRLVDANTNTEAPGNMFDIWAQDYPGQIPDPDTLTALQKLTGKECMEIYRWFYNKCQKSNGGARHPVQLVPQIEFQQVFNSSILDTKTGVSVGTISAADIVQLHEAVSRYAVPKCASKKSQKDLENNKQKPWDEEKPFSCFLACGFTCRTKSDYKRHLLQLYPHFVWVCNLAETMEPSVEKSCTFKDCESPAIEENHWSIVHGGYVPCCQKPLMPGKGGRLFFRLDHLQQHMDRWHPHLNLDANFLDTLKHPVDNCTFPMKCGFCRYSFPREQMEVSINHLAVHFRNGKSLRDWRDPWPEPKTQYNTQNEGCRAREAEDKGSEDDDGDKVDEDHDEHVDDVDEENEHNEENEEDEENKEDEEDEDDEGDEDDKEDADDEDDKDDDNDDDQGGGSGQGNDGGSYPNGPSSDNFLDRLDRFFDDQDSNGQGGGNDLPLADFFDFDIWSSLSYLRDVLVALHSGTVPQPNFFSTSRTNCTVLHLVEDLLARHSITVIRTNESGPHLNCVRIPADMICLSKSIACGAMGVVNKVYFRDQPKALAARKAVHLNRSHELKSHVTSLILEYFILSTLQHAHVANAIGLVYQSPCLGLLMPLACGDLYQVLSYRHKDDGILPYTYADFNCLLSALSFMHKKGVVHNDIKPSNILWYKAPNGNDSFAFSDFGCSRLSPSQYTYSMAFVSTNPPFTQKYAAPERVRGNHTSYSTHSDVFSLGCVFLEMMYALAFPGDPQIGDEREDLFTRLSEPRAISTEMKPTPDQLNAVRAMLCTSPWARPKASKVMQYFPWKDCCRPDANERRAKDCHLVTKDRVVSDHHFPPLVQAPEPDCCEDVGHSTGEENYRDLVLRYANSNQNTEERRAPIAPVRKEVFYHTESFSIWPQALSEAKYKYEPLREGSTIRILRILPATDASSPVRCHIETIDLDNADDFPYLALSYVWGRSIDNKEVYIDDHVVRMSENLDGILRYLRSNYSYRERWWIDALCINQADTDEKTNQIRLMQRIYKSAQKCVAWLGDSDEKIDKFIESQKPSGSRSHCQARSNGCQQDVIRRIVQRSWFSRVWTIQEAAMARSVWFIFDNGKISEKDLLSYCISCQNEDDYSNTFSKFRDKLAVIDFLRERNQKISLLELLERMRGFQTTDIRDRVFALLGVAKDIENLKIRLDYSLSAAEVFADVALAIIYQSGELEILSYAESSATDRALISLPSWVPDWTQTDRYVPLWSKAFGASHQTTVHRNKQSGFKLRLAAKAIGSVTQLHQACWLSSEWTANEGRLPNKRERTIVTGRNILRSLDEWPALHEAYFKRRTKKSSNDGILAFESVLACAGLSLTSDGSWVRHQYSYHLYVSVMLDKDLSPAAELYCTSIALRSWNRRLFVTENGYVGLGPAHAQPGDKIFVLAGGRVLFVLRSVDGKAVEYVLVGECYVYGLMDGEALGSEAEFTDIFIV